VSITARIARLFRRTPSTPGVSDGMSVATGQGPDQDGLTRDESFRVEALEPRILLSADPILGELARLADSAFLTDPQADIIAIIQQIDELQADETLAAEVELAEDEAGQEAVIDWPDTWLEETPDEGENDPIEIADTTGPVVSLSVQEDGQIDLSGFLTTVHRMRADSPVDGFATQSDFVVSIYQDTSNSATGPPAETDNTLKVNENSPNPLADTGLYTLDATTQTTATTAKSATNAGQSSPTDTADGTLRLVGADLAEGRIAVSIGSTVYLSNTAFGTNWSDDAALWAGSLSQTHALTLEGTPQTSDADALSAADLADAFDRALNGWAAATGTDTAALALTARLADLDVGRLAQITGTEILVDRTAAGAGWFVDATPTDHAEYTTLYGAHLMATSGPAGARIDLDTVLLHEVGHALGFAHDDALPVMAESLAIGTRSLLPTQIAAPDTVSTDGAVILNGSAVAAGNLYYDVKFDGTVSVFRDAALTNAVAGSQNLVNITEIIAAVGSASWIYGPDETFQTTAGFYSEATWQLDGPQAGILVFRGLADLAVSITFQNFVGFEGGNDTDKGAHRVIGRDTDTVWSINGPNQGTVSWVEGGATRLDFRNIAIVQGGSASDAIVFGTGGLLTGGPVDAAGNPVSGIDVRAGGVTEVTVGDFLTISTTDASPNPFNFSYQKNVTVDFDSGADTDADGLVVDGTAAPTLTGLQYIQFGITNGSIMVGSDVAGYFSALNRNDNNLVTDPDEAIIATGFESQNATASVRVYLQQLPGSTNRAWVSAEGTADDFQSVNLGGDTGGFVGSVFDAGFVLVTQSVDPATNMTPVILLDSGLATNSVVATLDKPFAYVTGTGSFQAQEKVSVLDLSTPANLTDTRVLDTDQVFLEGRVTITKTIAQNVTLPTPAGVANGSLFVFDLQDGRTFVGAGAEFETTPGTGGNPPVRVINTEKATGFLAENANVTFAIFKTNEPVTVADPASVIYFAVDATVAATALGVELADLEATELSIRLNLASDGSDALNWQQVAFIDPDKPGTPGDTHYVELNFTGVELTAEVVITVYASAED